MRFVRQFLQVTLPQVCSRLQMSKKAGAVSSAVAFFSVRGRHLAIHFLNEYNYGIRDKGVLRLACPFFVPTNRFEDGGWTHPSRLPLGAGWRGQCSAPGHEGAEPEDDDLRELCNLGYSSACPRLPKERSCDAVRFGVAHDRGSRLAIWFVCESAHRPGEHGTLAYDLPSQRWLTSHSDYRIQRMAECYLESYLLRRTQPASAELQVSTIE